jgi:hypothetical protein
MVNEVETIEWFSSCDGDLTSDKRVEISDKILKIVKKLIRLMAVDFSVLSDKDIDLSTSGLFFNSDDVAFITENTYFHKSCNFRLDGEDFVFELTARKEI